MTHERSYAALIENNIVTYVISIPYCEDNDDIITKYCNECGLEGKWIDTSYTGKRRGKYANIGDYYNEQLNIFQSLNQEGV